MATVSIHIRIDSDIKEKANEIFENLGLDMTTAVDVFLRQVINEGTLPFHIQPIKTYEVECSGGSDPREPWSFRTKVVEPKDKGPMMRYCPETGKSIPIPSEELGDNLDIEKGDKLLGKSN